MDIPELTGLAGVILATVGHDLWTPLASIKLAASSLLCDDIDWDESQVRSFLRRIDGEADRMTHLLSDLLDLSRIQAGCVTPALQTVEVGDVVSSAVTALGPVGTRVALHIPEDVAPVSADAGLLERALGNVIGNAVAWSPASSVVEVEADEADRVEIRVIDSGPGIPPEQREHVFLPFHRLNGARTRSKGFGLGLALSRAFTHALGGGLTVGDTPGGGATFVFSLVRA